MMAPYFQLGQSVKEIFPQLYIRKDTDFDKLFLKFCQFRKLRRIIIIKS